MRYTLSAVIDGQKLFLNPARNAFVLKSVRGCGTYPTFESANAECKRSRAFMGNETVEVVKVTA